MNGKRLDSIVKEVLADRGYTMHFFGRFISYAARAFEELSMDTLQSVKAYGVITDQYSTVTFGSDVTDIVRVGIRNGVHVIPLSQDKTLSITNHFKNGVRVRPDAVGTSRAELLLTDSLYGPLTEYRNDKGEHMGRFFNHIPESNLTYLWDSANSRLIINPRIPKGTELYVETLSRTQFNYNPWDISVDVRAIECLKQYMLWKHAESNPKYYGLGLIQLHREQYYVELKKLRGRMNSLDASEIKRILRKNGANVPKR